MKELKKERKKERMSDPSSRRNLRMRYFFKIKKKLRERPKVITERTKAC